MSKGVDAIEISFASNLSYVDLIQEISDNITRMVGFDEDHCYWIGMSVREAVVNAIQHGNGLDGTKKVGVRFEVDPDRLVILVHDQGQGFDLSRLPDPLDTNNLLKSTGRGVFYMRAFMDNVEYRRLPGSGFEVKMEKKLNHKKRGDGNEN